MDPSSIKSVDLTEVRADVKVRATNVTQVLVEQSAQVQTYSLDSQVTTGAVTYIMLPATTALHVAVYSARAHLL